MLAEMAEVGARDSGGKGPIVDSQRAIQLKDLGINASQSSRWQQEFNVPAKEFERYVSDKKDPRRWRTRYRSRD